MTQKQQLALKKGRYQLGKLLGRGGCGTVYKATDSALRLFVAIKALNLSDIKPNERKQAIVDFQGEGQMIKELRDPRNPHIPRFHDIIQDKGNWYLVMEYIEGETLADYIKKQSGKRLPVEKAFGVILQLCDVLHYLHTRRPQPIVFRDVKPENIMLTPSGHIYLIDFGIALYFKEGTPDPQRIGTPEYAPPEQYQGNSCPASDIYPLGTILHEMLTGKDLSKPLMGNVPELDGHPNILEELDTLIQNMVNPKPTLRDSAEVVKQKLTDISQRFSSKATAIFAAPTAAPTSSTAGQSAVQSPVAPARRKKRSKVFVTVLAIVLLSLWLGPGGLWHFILLKVGYQATITSVNQHDATRWSPFSGSYTTTTYDVGVQWTDQYGPHWGIFQTDNSSGSTILEGDTTVLDCLPATSNCILDL